MVTTVEERLLEIESHENKYGGQRLTANEVVRSIGNRSASFALPLPKNIRAFRNSLTPDTLSGGGALIGGDIVASLTLAMTDTPMLRTATVTVVDDPAATHSEAGIGDLSVEADLKPSDAAASAVDISDCVVLKLQRKKQFFAPPVKTSRTLIDDSPLLAANMAAIIGGRLGRGMNRQFSVGTGGNYPLGLLYAAPSGKTTASPTAFVVDELLALVSQIPDVYLDRPTCGWMMSKELWLMIRAMKDSSGRPLWKASGLNQWPVYKNKHFPTALTSGQPCLVFGDLAAYRIALFGPTFFQVLTDSLGNLALPPDTLVFLGNQYADGGLLDPGDHPVVSLTVHS